MPAPWFAYGNGWWIPSIVYHVDPHSLAMDTTPRDAPEVGRWVQVCSVYPNHSHTMCIQVYNRHVLYTQTLICIHTNTHTRIYIYMCVHIRIYAYIYIYIYTYTHVYNFMHKSDLLLPGADFFYPVTGCHQLPLRFGPLRTSAGFDLKVAMFRGIHSWLMVEQRWENHQQHV